MTPTPSSATQAQPAYALHAAVLHLDAGAEQLLHDQFGISYQRFLLLLTLDRIGPCTQRAIAGEMVLNEPTTSRAVAAAQNDGHVLVEKIPGQGNRRTVSLTDAGRDLHRATLAMLEQAFADVIEAAGIEASAVLDLAHRILRVVGPQSSEIREDVSA